MLGVIGIIAIIGAVLLINHVIGGFGQGIVGLLQKFGIGKTGSYVLGCCLFLVLLAFLKHFLASRGIFA
ncbi:hypothetical protein [Anaerotignum sp.]|uniref:hypothetical protein n=1 Tax=Anaerotignum sp. TaxID=2039241 RepID=UPI00289F2DC7|nr:hypothetical protein [Anaerotignum sp.]